MSPFTAAVTAFLLSAAAEGLLAGPNAIEFLESLRRPRWALSMPAYFTVGLAYYLACYVAVYRLMELEAESRWPALGLVIAVMVGNAVWTHLFFRLKKLYLSYVYGFAQVALVSVMMLHVLQVDPKAATFFWIYAAYLPYSMALIRSLGTLNPEVRALS